MQNVRAGHINLAKNVKLSSTYNQDGKIRKHILQTKIKKDVLKENSGRVKVMPYVEKKILSGDLLEVKRYFSTKGNTNSRADKEKASDERQIMANEKEAERWLVRKINTNFSAKKNDLFVTLTYADDVEEDEARQDFKNFIRRLRRYCKKNKIELRYAGTTEKQSKWHHHIILSNIPLEELNQIWGKGRVTASILNPTNNFEDLAAYLAKHVKSPKGDPNGENIKEARKKFKRRWVFSRNLKNPIVTVKEIKRQSILKKAPTAPRGFYLLPDWNIGCDSWGNLYQYFKCKKIEKQEKSKDKKTKTARKEIEHG